MEQVGSVSTTGLAIGGWGGGEGGGYRPPPPPTLLTHYSEYISRGFLSTKYFYLGLIPLSHKMLNYKA